MSALPFQRIEDVLHAVLARPPEERAAVLSRLCSEDAALQAEVHALLRAHEQAGSFVTRPAIESLGPERCDRVLEPGSRWGPFEVGTFLAAGGMGEVYRAHDTRLGRDVAIKTLRRVLAADPERLARLEREARVLAALTHPNIAVIHGLEEHDSTRGLVLELVEGQTLADRLARGPLPIGQALKIAQQIVEALNAAHAKGIVHRDLKPANVSLAPDDTVKVLDFGLATLSAWRTAVDARDAADAVAPLASMSSDGLVQGTASYMSPEQVSGQAVDKRTDIWAFGCVLYEMLTGTRVFEGTEIGDTLARVLDHTPDWAALPADAPPPVRRLLRRCLEKDRSRRLADIADARLELEEASRPGSEAEVQALSRGSTRRQHGVLAVVALVVISVAIRWIGSPPLADESSVAVTRLLVAVAPAERLAGNEEGRPTRTEMALAPDGRSLVFAAVREGRQMLYLRRFDEPQASVLAGTQGGSSPFFSPDGRWVGFLAHDELRKVPVDGGPAQTIAKVPLVFGASWSIDNRIVLAFHSGGLWQVAAGGGVFEALTSLDADRGEVSHRLPHILPDGDVLFTVTRNRFPRWDETEIALYSRRSGTHRVLLPGGADARYVPSGHLVYVREGVLMAVPFDSVRGTISGEPVALVDDVMQSAYHQGTRSDSGTGHFTLSGTGTLVYASGGVFPEPQRHVLMVDRNGREQRVPIPPRFFSGQARLSPDGERAALFTSGRDQDIWVADLRRGTLSRLTTEGRNAVPIWTADGTRIVYRASITGPDGLFWQPADGSSGAELLVRSEQHQVPAAWSPDGDTLAFYRLVPDGTDAASIWLLSREGDRPPRRFVDSPFGQSGADFSPDGKWLAYASNESGRLEVYARAFPGPGPVVQISAGGGGQPVWARDGRELFYIVEAEGEALALMAVQITLEPTLRIGAARRLFQGRYVRGGPARAYDVTPDGRRFLFMENPQRPVASVTHLIVVQNWVAELKQRAPASRW